MKADERILDTTIAIGARGGSLYFWGGKIMTGPDFMRGIGSLVMILLPSVLLDIFVVPGFEDWEQLIIYLVIIPFQVLSAVFLLCTIYSNPGVLPRQIPFTQQYDFLTREYRPRAPERFQDIILGSEPVRLKYCTTCGIYRPPRCSHCSTCDNCVDKFDHHCPWVGNCVGRANYQRFYFFVLSTALLTLGTMAICITLLILRTARNQDLGFSGGQAFSKTLSSYPMALVLLIYSSLLSWFTVGLAGYHSYLVAIGMSTNEQIKGHLDKHNPYSEGVWKNLLKLLRPSRWKPMDFLPVGRLPPLRAAYDDLVEHQNTSPSKQKE